jgi:hypothetical protein
MQKRFLALLLVSIVLLLSFASAKSYTIDKADVGFVINPNGSVNVTEYITFNFNGSFTYAYRDLPNEWSYSNFHIYDGETELQYETTPNGNSTQYKWHYSAIDQVKTFKMI